MAIKCWHRYWWISIKKVPVVPIDACYADRNIPSCEKIIYDALISNHLFWLKIMLFGLAA